MVRLRPFAESAVLRRLPQRDGIRSSAANAGVKTEGMALRVQAHDEGTLLRRHAQQALTTNCRGKANQRLQNVTAFAMLGEIQTLGFLIRAHPQSYNGVDQAKQHPGADPAPDGDGNHT